MLMYLVNGVQFLSVSFLLALLSAEAIGCATVIVPLTSIY